MPDSLPIKKLIREPLFAFGLVIRLLLIVIAVPLTQQEWFVPFLRGYVFSPSLDPWSAHLAHGGNPLAFPYGPVMFLAYLPAVALGSLIDLIFHQSNFVFIGFGLTTLLCDFALLVCLARLLNPDLKKLLLFYWLSPLVIYICYWHGQIDALPVVLFGYSLLTLKDRRPIASGILLGAAISAKLSMVLAAPFLLIYLWQNSRVRSQWRSFVSALSLTLIIGQGLALLSPGFIQMALESPEVQKVYAVAINLGEGLHVYLLPVLYALVLYGAWRMERMSSELLFALLGIGFFLVLILTPASSGWYLWVIPFLVDQQIRTGILSACLGVTFALLYTVTNLAFSSGAYLNFFQIDLTQPLLQGDVYSHLHSLLITGTCALAVLISVRMFIHGIRRNDYFRLSRRPLAIGIAGDSGSGKDTLAVAIAGLFGDESVTNICGDDYHKWDRKAPMWQAVTHLDPRGNNLHQFTRDVISLLDGRSVVCRKYDHETGCFTRGQTVRKNDCLIISGLHALYIPEINQNLDVGIFLDMDEGLRSHFKIKRDVHERKRDESSVRESIQKRQPDAERYIQHQAELAQLVFSLLPADANDVHSSAELSRYKLKVTLRGGLFYEDLIRMLVGLCGMQVDYSIEGRSGTVQMVIEGEVTPEDVAMAARETIAKMEELIAVKPRWYGGMLGVMQLVTLNQIYDSLRSRMLYGPRYA